MSNQTIKFKAIGRRALIIPYVLFDSNGQVVHDGNITFSNGGKFQGKIIEATYGTSDPREIEYIRGFAERNPGFVQELKSKASVAETKNQPTEKAKKEEPKVSENEEQGEVELQAVDSVSTLQEAIVFLKKHDPKFKITSVKSVPAVKSKGEEYGFDFVNL